MMRHSRSVTAGLFCSMTMTEKTIMGIDPGTNLLGFGVIRVSGRNVAFVDMGVLDMRKEKDHFSKLRMLDGKMEELLDRYRPDELSVESPFYGKNPQVMLKLGRAQGAAVTAALRRGIHVEEYAPRKAKIAITGVGSASKEQVCTMIQKILGVRLRPEHLDATDALALALCHYFSITSPVSAARSSGDWKHFIEANPDRVK